MLDRITYPIRNCTAAIAGLAMRRTAFRFDKNYRWGTTRRHRIVYATVNTIAANYVAEGDHPLVAVFWGYSPQRHFER